ncbi:outer membrane beta-barrel protein [Helicobacter sp. 11S02596-1]|uniref:outer membrane beta-barrel protein n=1 Tax=Helicobacter sp. 11S02596-1 TaxID=1476194 RepID=UPI000BD72B4E|nr:outer membrane beta-barrel protein [Helicobacter sp. 11S02596-1]PAF42386.1 hypothetical protein BJI48_07090 [Helicobacter sp. 11S02596-1]
MRIIVFLSLVLLGLNATEPNKSQIFIGGALGMADISKMIDGQKDTPNSYKAFVWGARGGYQFSFLNGYLAIRTYLDYLMAIKPLALDTITSSVLSLNLDLLADFLHIGENAFGVYGGVGFGYFQHANVIKVTPEDKALVYGYTGVLNFGLGASIQSNHRVELGIKIPFSRVKSIANPAVSYENIYASASYSYLF